MSIIAPPSQQDLRALLLRNPRTQSQRQTRVASSSTCPSVTMTSRSIWKIRNHWQGRHGRSLLQLPSRALSKSGSFDITLLILLHSYFNACRFSEERVANSTDSLTSLILVFTLLLMFLVVLDQIPHWRMLFWRSPRVMSIALCQQEGSTTMTPIATIRLAWKD